jgi:shikimate kinase
MPRPRFVIVSGPPAAGKTTSAPLLAQALSMPLFSIDTTKERFADAIGRNALEFADEIGEAALRHTVATVHELLAIGDDVMIEGFIRHGPYEPLIEPLIAMADTVLIHLHAEDLELKDRYESRAVQPHRHWIHNDIARLGTLTPELPAPLAAPLALAIPRIFVATTAGPLPVSAVVALVMSALANPVARDYTVTAGAIA